MQPPGARIARSPWPCRRHPRRPRAPRSPAGRPSFTPRQEGHPVDHASGVLARQAQASSPVGPPATKIAANPSRAECLEGEVDARRLAVSDLDAEAHEGQPGPGRSAPAGGGRPGSRRRPSRRGVRVLLEDRGPKPAWASHSAAARPAGPAPMIATRAWAVEPTGSGAGPTSCSMMNRLICRIANGWSRCVRHAGVLAQVVADPAEDRGQRVVEPGDANGLGKSPERTAAM